MTPADARAAVGSQRAVVARTGNGDEYGRGRVVAYSVVPTVTIERPDGSRFEWRHDMVDEAIAGWCPFPNEVPIDHGLLRRACGCGWSPR